MSAHACHTLIRVRSHLGPAWSDSFADLRLTHDPDGTTRLEGPVADQAALHGILARIRDLGLTLIFLQYDAQPPYPSQGDPR